MRQNLKQRARNRARSAGLKTRLRKCKEQMAHGSSEAATAAFHEAARALDIAASLKTIHRNAASRRKSRLARRLNALKSKAAPA